MVDFVEYNLTALLAKTLCGQGRAIENLDLRELRLVRKFHESTYLRYGKGKWTLREDVLPDYNKCEVLHEMRIVHKVRYTLSPKCEGA